MLKITLYFIVALSPLKGTGIIEDSSDFVEINHVYRYNNLTDKYEKSFIQIIWWEWKDNLWTERGGDYKKSSVFVVKDYRVTWSNSSRPEKLQDVLPQKDGKKWLCLFFDKKDRVVRSISSNWITETHTSFDRETQNRKILSIERRSGLKNATKTYTAE